MSTEVKTINPKTAETIKLIDSAMRKLSEGFSAYGRKLTQEEVNALGLAALVTIGRYQTGQAHVCEFPEGGFKCVVCGQSL